MSQQEVWTVKRLLEWTTLRFTKQSIDSAQLEASLLLAAAMGIKRIELYMKYDSIPAEAVLTKFREFVKRRLADEPVAYILGSREFFSLSFEINKNVLIPRPETEDLVIKTLDILKTLPENTRPRLCDAGTGSGAIAVAAAKNWSKHLAAPTDENKIIAVDIDENALSLAKTNAEKNGVADRIEFIQSDLLENTEGTFDIIVSNPPYISQSEYDALPPLVKNYEPQLALLAGNKGTEVIEKIAAQAAEKLNSGGTLLLEISPFIADFVRKLLLPNWNEVEILKDSFKRDRIAVAVKR
ncbi:MAG: peptide chain release factor N(5)-glutamine methyltransferase [Planctomycetaceae bacterium]|nr:peptide chain release factor N(5)-glutamine methyltransferase [Planctomycetaceae bacterium]